jgi:transposase
MTNNLKEGRERLLTMANVNDIRVYYFNQGKSLSEIHRKTGFDYKTIRKYLRQDDFNLKPVLKRKVESKLAPYHDVIDNWLLGDKKRHRKQRHTARRVYKRLVEDFPDFNASYRTVATYYRIRYDEIWQQQGFIPLTHPGGEAQVDFGKTEYFDNGQRIPGSHLVLSFPKSNAGYVLLFPGESAECMLAGLQLIFEHIGGVPFKIWFDNASSIVTKIHKNGERSCTELFLRFKNHYNFEASFCNPASGNEKGSVENKVGYLRRNMFVPVPEISDIETFNQQLLEKCDKDHQRLHYKKQQQISELFSEEKLMLLPLPKVRFEVCRYVSAKTDACGRVRLGDGRIYSTSPSLAGKTVNVKFTANHVYILDTEMKEVVKHKRLYGNQYESMCWLPYLNQLSRKPGALKYTPVYQMLPQNLQQHLQSVTKKECGRILKTLAKLAGTHGFDIAVEATSKAFESGVKDPDSIIATFNRINSIDLDLKPVGLPDDIPAIPPVSYNGTVYDAFLKGGDE